MINWYMINWLYLIYVLLFCFIAMIVKNLVGNFFMTISFALNQFLLHYCSAFFIFSIFLYVKLFFNLFFRVMTPYIAQTRLKRLWSKMELLQKHGLPDNTVVKIIQLNWSGKRLTITLGIYLCIFTNLMALSLSSD